MASSFRGDSPAIRDVSPTRGLIDRASRPAAMLALVAIGLSFVGVTRQISDPDFWWHLRAGQIILDTHSLIATDPFTYTAVGHPWTMHEWLTEVVFALLYRVGGLGLIVATVSFITWLGILCIVARARLNRPHNIVLALGLVLGVITGYPIWGPRAQMITFALACLVLWVGERHLRQGGRLLWALVPIFLIWSNLHSGFIIGLGFLGLLMGAEIIGGLVGWAGGADRRRVRDLAVVLAICALVAMINPNGPGIVLYPFATQGSPAQQAVIQEWHSPDFHDSLIRFGFAPMLFSLVLLIIINRKIRARDAAMVVVTVALSLQSVRHIALFVAGCTPVWITQADMTVRRIGTRFHRRPAAPPPLGLRIVVTSVVLLLVVGIPAAIKLSTSTAVTETDISYARDQPVCAARWLSAAPHPVRIFNQYGEGGYLAYKLSAAGNRVFIFGDAALMGDDLLIQYGDIQNLQPQWESLLRASGTDIVVFDAGAPLPNTLAQSPRWTRLYADPKTDIYTLTSNIEKLGLTMPPDAGGARSGVCADLMRLGRGSQ